MPVPHPLPIALTYEDYLGFPSDGNRHEILEGEHTMTPAPSPDHQFVVGSFLYFFRLQVRDGVAYAAPLDVLLSPTTIVQPDVCYVGMDKLSCVTSRGLEGAPDIVIEVLSPSTSRLDEVTKRHLYAKHGVGEYWLVDAERGAVRVCIWSESGFRPEADHLLTGSDRLTTSLAPGLDVLVAELFWPSATRRS
ncbi:MAG TPA: Uma2 family endonuclease [Thermoanaerobaculia bacterium]|jgi:Uma2 family endonuclease|nr:Uma2 family endonuclease [Thermoanaerobaculia bacterium]